MWSIYADKGVRIKIQSNMFANFFALKEYDYGFVPIGRIVPINIKGHYNSNTGEPISVNTIYGPIKIDYVENEQNTYKNAVKTPKESSIFIPEDFLNITISELGNKKVKYWQYENEWRFKIISSANCIASTDAFAKADDIKETYAESIDVPLGQPIIEIMTAPKIPESEYDRIKNFLDENDLKINLVRSEIKIKKS